MEKVNKKDIEEGFYKECAQILGVHSEYKAKNLPDKITRRSGESYKPVTLASRWGGREPGNGRFPGCGIIRMFGVNQIHVSLYHPIVVSRTFDDPEKVLEFLRENI